jgi:hypothetical protein
MLWFNKEKKQKMDVLKNFVPTSKAQLIQVAMFMNNGDVNKAQEFFDFYSKNLDLPDFEPVAPTFMQQVKGFFSWAKENQGDIVQGYQFIQSIIKNKGEVVMTPEGSPLPPINE